MDLKSPTRDRNIPSEENIAGGGVTASIEDDTEMSRESTQRIMRLNLGYIHIRYSVGSRAEDGQQNAPIIFSDETHFWLSIVKSTRKFGVNRMTTTLN